MVDICKTKTSELTGAALDWAVAKCEQQLDEDAKLLPVEWHLAAFSTDWAQGGEIIERERLDITPWGHEANKDRRWQCVKYDAQGYYKSNFGCTPLVAAMRAYVASKLGDEIGVPEELLK